jgi:hypothetical protein
MQFFYIDLIDGGRREANLGFLKFTEDGISVVIKGVPAAYGESLGVYALNAANEHMFMGNIRLKKGYGTADFGWDKRYVGIEIPLGKNKRGICIVREEKHCGRVAESSNTESMNNENITVETDKWRQLLNTYPQVHVCVEADSILIKPKDTVILTDRYQSLAANSFLLHSYYNYRQLLLFRYPDGPQYYLGVAGVYYERQKRLAKLFGFEGFENGEARLNADSTKSLYEGCFGYYMKQVEI